MVAPNPSSSSEQVRYDILIEAKAAIQAMRDMLKYTADNTVKMAEFTNQVLLDSRKWGVSWEQALLIYKQLNAELAKQKKGTLFGQTGGQDLFGKTEEYIKSLQDAGRLTDFATDGSKRMGNETKSAFERAITGVNGFRIALGAVISMLLFQGIQAISQFFQTAIKNAQELEASLYRIHNAERILSGEGIEVSVKGLEDGIKRIKNLLPIFSKEDIAGLVGQVAITTKSLGLTEKQIVELSQAIAILNVNSAEEETLQATAQHVISSLLTSNAKGVANLGLKLGDAAIEAKAFSMGLLEAGESASALTDHEKSIVKVQIAIDGAAQSIAGLDEFMASNTAKLQQNKAAWNDLLTTVGQVILPFIPLVTKLFSLLNDGFNGVKTALVVILTLITSFSAIWLHLGEIKSLDTLKKVLREVGEEAKRMWAKIFFPEGVPDNAPQAVKDFLGDLSPAETPTGVAAPDFGEDQAAQDKRAKAIEDAQNKLQDILRESADKKLDIERDYQRKLADIATNYEQKLEDIARNTAQKREDALRNLNDKLADIDRDINQKIADAKNEERKKEIDREAQFQNRLRELREKFLFDLEDALHERDARQVLRLIRQYNMDKKNLEERHKLEQEQSKKDLQQKLVDLEAERQQKIEAAKREYEDKLREIAIGEARDRAEANLWRSRQLADARLWYQRQLQDQQQYLQRKLRDLAEALKKELQMNASAAGMLSSIWQNAYSSVLGSNVTPIASNGAITGYSAGGWDALANTWANSGMYGTGGMAEGGNLIATRPTKVTVGERGPEQLSVTPLSKIGNNVNKTFGDKSAMDMGGSVKIALELSPDLEARIVDSSLDNFAVTLERVTREK